MPISIKIIKIATFRQQGLIINQPTQLVDENEMGFFEGDGVLEFKPQGEIFQVGSRIIEPYFANYDYRMDKSGMVFEKNFRYYFVNEKFHVYKTNDDLLLLATRKKVADSFIKELKSEKTQGKSVFQFKDLKIDFDQIISKAENVTGLWSQVDRTNLNSQAFFGDHVTEDAEVKLVLQEKKTSFIQFDLSIDNKIFKLGITKGGSIISYTTSFTSQEVLELSLIVYDFLLK